MYLFTQFNHNCQQCHFSMIGAGNSQGEKQSGENSGGTGSACNTLSSNKGTSSVTMNHINAGASTKTESFTLVNNKMF